MAVLSAVAAIGAIFDDRTLVNASIWLKPFKFTVSIAIYSLTLAWMISLLPKARRWGWWMGTLVAAGLAVDMALLVWQIIFRGRQLHFNRADPTDKLMSDNILPAATYLVWAATLVVVLLLLFQRLPDKAQATAVRMGLAIALGRVGARDADVLADTWPEGRDGRWRQAVHRRSAQRGSAGRWPGSARPGVEHGRRRPPHSAFRRHARVTVDAALRAAARCAG
jgi:hypothetical protein